MTIKILNPYMYQPIDAGMNKPLKSKIGDLWEDWVDMESMKDVSEIPTPTHELVASWAVECYWMLDNKSARMHGKRRALNG